VLNINRFDDDDEFQQLADFENALEDGEYGSDNYEEAFIEEDEDEKITIN